MILMVVFLKELLWPVVYIGLLLSGFTLDSLFWMMNYVDTCAEQIACWGQEQKVWQAKTKYIMAFDHGVVLLQGLIHAQTY